MCVKTAINTRLKKLIAWKLYVEYSLAKCCEYYQCRSVIRLCSVLVLYKLY